MKRVGPPLVLAVALIGCAGPTGAPQCATAAPSAACTYVTIPRGATLDATIDTLVAHGIIKRPWPFSLYARLRGLRNSMKSGTYGFAAGGRTKWREVVDALARGRGAMVRFTIPEGLMLNEIADLAVAQFGVSRDSFLAATRDPGAIHDLDLPASAQSLEGYLYPTTYTIRAHPGAGDLVAAMIAEFRMHWLPEWQPLLDSLGMTRYQVVTLASIIQAEVRYAPDRPYVSAVYHNRLKRGMLLQADPTVIYAEGRRLRRVYEHNLLVRSPYNTYLHPGLPPGPICQPDSASLHAALFPAAVPYLYFVAQPDGKHIFSVTYADHVKAIETVHRLQRAARAPRTADRQHQTPLQ